MKRILVLLPALLALSILAGCMSTVVISTTDEELREDLNEAWDEVRKDLQEDLSDMETDGEDFDDVWDGIFGNLEDDWSAKAHRWQILDAQGEEILTISSEDGVAAIDALLQDDGWAYASGESGEPLYTYVFWQQKTLLAGQAADAEREYEELIRFTVPVDGEVVTMNVLPQSLSGMEIAGLDLGELLTVSGKVPAETAEALRNPEQWNK
ncbi:MAG: hypothetical protein HDT19_01795 [Oscillibacter sp.]|nr:hypothetical protein [Oscillibacter sp.]